MFSKIFAEIWRKNSAKQYDSKIKMQKNFQQLVVRWFIVDYNTIKKCD